MRQSVCLFLMGLASATAAFALEPPVLRVGLETEPATLDWRDARSSADRFILSFLMRGLMKYDSQGRLSCDLCQSHRESKDGRTATFDLRPGILWSDGKPLEAQQFLDPLRRMGLGRAHAEGKRTLVLELSRPDPGLLHELTTVASFPFRNELSPAEHPQLAVLGPYVLAEWKRGKHLVIEGNPEFLGSRPVYRVVFTFGKHAERVAAFRAGKIDILTQPTTEDALKIPGQKITVNPYWATRLLLFNGSRAGVARPALRRAILYSLDRETLPAFLRNGERRVTGLIPPGLPGYRELPLVTADPERARTERAQAFPDSKAPALKLLITDREDDRRVAQWLTERLLRVQLRVDPVALAEPAYFTALEKGDFDLALNTWAFQTANAQELLRAFRTGAARNRAHFTSVGYDALLDQLLQQTDPTRAGSEVDQLTQLLEVQEVAAIPLGYPTQLFLLGPRVVSFAITPFGDPDLVKIELRH